MNIIKVNCLVRRTDKRVFINKEQYFDCIPVNVWEFPIGSYKPAQTWLKYRKGRKLNTEDLIHYQKIIASIERSIEIKEQINKINFL